MPLVRRSAALAATVWAAGLLSGCGSDEAVVDPRAALMRFCQSSGGGDSCACGVDLMMETLEDADLAVVATIADQADEDTHPAVLLAEMVERGDLAVAVAQSLTSTMEDFAMRIIEECGTP